MVTSPTLEDEVAFITGVKANGTLTQYSYWGWNHDNPATYNSGWTRAAKFGGNTAGTSGGTVNFYFDPSSNWSSAEQAQLASGLALWSAVANIKFVQTTDSSKGQISFKRGNDGGAYTYTIFSSSTGACENGGTILGTITAAPISIDTHVGGFGPIKGDFSSWGGYPIETYLHEMGHALGLGHGGAYNGSAANSQQYSAYDMRQWSIMSYFNPGSGKFAGQNPVPGTGWSGNYPTTWMPLDILAIQRLYGVAVTTPLDGGETFGFNCNIDPSIKQYFDFTVNKKPVITIWDKGTGNTLDLSGFGCATTINLNPGTFSSTNGMKNNIAIAAGTAIDKLVCSSGASTVTCNNDGDVILGGAGNDIFTGGTGNDALNGGGGTDLVKYAGVRSAYTVTSNADGSTTISGGGAGTDTLTDIETVKFADTSITLTGTPPVTPPALSQPQRDFNGNAKGDVLLGNAGNASVQVWLMDGTSKKSGATLKGPGSNWSTVMTGDFNGDGKTDILWQNVSTSAVQIWTMNGTAKASSGTVSSVPGAGWAVKATGDFNADGKADIVLENGNQVQIWLMNGSTQLAGGGAVAATAASGFAVIATGDFNDDGKADILWQNSTTGQLDIWMMNGTILASDNLLPNTLGSNWRAVTTGDFNADGKADILLQDSTTGQAAIWMMDGANVLAASGNVSSNLGTAWKAVGSADYNGDGSSDILFRSTSNGSFTAWMMTGTTMSSGGLLSVNPGTGWHAVAG